MLPLVIGSDCPTLIDGHAYLKLHLDYYCARVVHADQAEIRWVCVTSAETYQLEMDVTTITVQAGIQHSVQDSVDDGANGKGRGGGQRVEAKRRL